MTQRGVRASAGLLRVGACQTPEIMGDPDAALACIEDFARRGSEQAADLLLFPECFLQGYRVDGDHVTRWALDVGSASFTAVLRRLEPLAPTLVFGIIESDRGRHFNTAVVVSRGRLVGRYRKTCLMPGETVFTAGDSCPTFTLGDVRYGINICSDTQHREPAARVAAQGAGLLLVPAQNMMRHEPARQWKDRHHRIRARRARETGMWVVSSDVTGTRGDDRIAYGPTSVISPRGDVEAQVPLMTAGLVVAGVAG